MRKIVVFMKKYVIISLIALVAAVFTGCKDDAVQCKYHTDTLDLTVDSLDWGFDEETLQFYYHFDVSAISEKIYNYGNWTICREFNKGNKNAYQVALPMSTFGHYTPTTGQPEVYFTRHIDYRVGIGYVEIQVTDSDFPYPVDPSTGKHIPWDFTPETMFFRLQLIY